MESSKINEELSENIIVSIMFPVESESGYQSKTTITIWFEDQDLFEGIVEESDCTPIIGMINEILPKGIFLADVPTGWDLIKNPNKIHLKVNRNMKLY